MRTLYMALRVPPACTPDELRTAYLELAKQHHPDRGGDAAYFGEVTAAWGVLKDPVLRRGYDRVLELRGGRCEKCEGKGVRYKQISFTISKKEPCKTCHGTGQANVAVEDYQ